MSKFYSAIGVIRLSFSSSTNSFYLHFTLQQLIIAAARFVGVLHFSTGFILTYAAFILGATS